MEIHLRNLKLSNNITLDFLEALPYEKEYTIEDTNEDKNESPDLAIFDSYQDSVS